MVTVGVDSSLELLTCLCESINVACHIAEVDIIVGCSVDEQQLSVQFVHINNGRAFIVSLFILFGGSHGDSA